MRSTGMVRKQSPDAGGYSAPSILLRNDRSFAAGVGVSDGPMQSERHRTATGISDPGRQHYRPIPVRSRGTHNDDESTSRMGHGRERSLPHGLRNYHL